LTAALASRGSEGATGPLHVLHQLPVLLCTGTVVSSSLIGMTKSPLPTGTGGETSRVVMRRWTGRLKPVQHQREHERG
jgi:hypothetical protein